MFEALVFTSASKVEAETSVVAESSSIIFYNVDDRNEELMTESKICIPFGYKNEILSHDNITVEDLCSLAKLNNDTYNKEPTNKL